MMSNQKVYFIVDVTIHEGKLATFEATAKTMTEGTLKESGALGYEWYLSKDHKQCRLIETYADGNAAFAHVSGPVVQQLVPKMLENCSLTSFKVYGDPGPKASEILAKVGAEIVPLWHGLGR
jgi:quinol monooxygenase YgiN